MSSDIFISYYSRMQATDIPFEIVFLFRVQSFMSTYFGCTSTNRLGIWMRLTTCLTRCFR